MHGKASRCFRDIAFAHFIDALNVLPPDAIRRHRIFGWGRHGFAFLQQRIGHIIGIGRFRQIVDGTDLDGSHGGGRSTLRLPRDRPGDEQAGEGDDWREVDDWASLIAALNDFQRPLFTLGREPLEHLHEIPLHQHWTVRCLTAQQAVPRAEIIGARGPFALDEERALFARLGTDVLISKNSGSQSTEPKLQVARELGLPVLLLRRPLLPSVDREFVSLEALTEALQL